MQAMIFAAGKGTRLKPITDSLPKALVKVKGKTLLERTIEKLKAAGCRHIVVNVHHFSNQIKDFIAERDFGVDIKISDETERLLDTGGGIRAALELLDTESPVLIHNVDIISNVDLRSFCGALPGWDVLLLVSRRKTKRYLIFDEEMRLAGWTNVETREVRSPHERLRRMSFEAPESGGFIQHGHRLLAFSGIHVASPAMLGLIGREREEAFPIMDFYLREAGQLRIGGFEKPDLQLLDVGKQDTLAQAERFIDEL